MNLNLQLSRCQMFHSSRVRDWKKKFAACHLRMSRNNVREQHKVKADAGSLKTHQHVVGDLRSSGNMLHTLQPAVSAASALRETGAS